MNYSNTNIFFMYLKKILFHQSGFYIGIYTSVTMVQLVIIKIFFTYFILLNFQQT